MNMPAENPNTEIVSTDLVTIPHPTQQAYGELELAFDFFNEHLFDNRLPRCMITLQRQHESYGYFSRDRFTNAKTGERIHEIALNPSYFAIHAIQYTLSVLAIEMVSVDQHLEKSYGRRRYKNKRWAEMAEAIGIMPSDTGKPGGKKTGEKLSHYIIEGGKFDIACAELVDEAFSISWVDRFTPMPEELIPDDDLDSGENRQALSPSTDTNEPQLSAPALSDGPLALSAIHEANDATAGSINESHLGDDAPIGGPGVLLTGDVASTTESSSSGKELPPMKHLAHVSLSSLKDQGFEVQETKKKQSRDRFDCPTPECTQRVWGKPGTLVACAKCTDKPIMVSAGLA